MKCPICRSENLITKETIISEFVRERIKLKNNKKIHICFCNDCTFAFYDYRLTNKQNKLLYMNYRSDEYQQSREKYECWYTKKVNNALNDNIKGIKEQQKIIEKIIKENINKEIKVALDYGGNEGKTFTDIIGTKEKYVYDISGAKTVDGVININKYNDLKKHSYDFIMCNMFFEHLSEPDDMLKSIIKLGNKDTVYYIEVPSENPFTNGNKFSIKNNLQLLFNPNFNNFNLFKYCIKTRKKEFMPMKEHVNFFTIESLKKLIINNNMEILTIEENVEKLALGSSKVLSVLFKEREK